MARPFSSDLSVAEAFVVREAGFAPIAQVMGSCFYQVGWQSMPWGQLGWTGSMREGETIVQADEIGRASCRERV